MLPKCLTPLPPAARLAHGVPEGSKAISPIISTRSMRSLRPGAGRSSREELVGRLPALASAAARSAGPPRLVRPRPRLPRDGCWRYQRVRGGMADVAVGRSTPTSAASTTST